MIGLTTSVRTSKRFSRHFGLDGRASLVQACEVELRYLSIGVVLIAGRDILVLHPLEGQCGTRVAIRIDST